MTLITYRYYDVVTSKRLIWVPRSALVRDLPTLCGIASGGVFVYLLVGNEWIHQAGSCCVMPCGDYKFEGNFKTKEEKKEEKRKRDLKRK